MPVSYKIYVEVFRKRLEDQVEEKGSIPHNQTGFRKGMGTVDNIYVLNYLVNRNLSQKKGKLIALFVDFKAAFDSVNRSMLWKAMKEREVDEELLDRIKEVFTETKTRVRIREEKGEEYWTGRGLWQGCPLSPLLFSIFIADLKEKMEKNGKGGVILGNKRIYSLAYADDVVLLADDEGGMKLLMKRFEEYVRRVKDDRKMRIWLFDSLAWSVLCYGVEIWGWKEYKKVENLQEIFLRWVTGVSWNCPGYMLREEIGREKLVSKQRKRAWNF